MKPDLTFQLGGTFPNGAGNATAAGKFDTAGNVSGTFDVHDSVDNAGTHYECDTGLVTFTGKLQSSG